MTYRNLLVGSSQVDLTSVTGLTVTDATGLLLTHGPLRQGSGNVTIEGMPGQAGTIKVYDQFDFTIGFRVSADDDPTFLAALAAVEALFPTNLLPFTRRMSQTLTPFYVDTTCDGEFVGITLTPPDGEPDSLTVDGVLNLRNLSGEWA